MKQVNEVLRDNGKLPDDCRACIVRQFARQVPVDEQLPCVQDDSEPRDLSATGVDQPVSAVKLLLKSSETAEKAIFLSKDALIYAPLVGTATDPTLFGAHVEICAGSATGSFDLPANFWHASGNGSVFKFTSTGSSTDVKVALIKGGRTLKVVSKAVGFPLSGSVGPVAVRVTTGDVRNCALFTQSTILRDEPGKYVAQSALAGAIVDCSDASLGCSSQP